MKILELFGGIGAWHKAIKRLELPCELVGFAEIDPIAAKAYCAIHSEPTSKNLGDIKTIDTAMLPEIDLICASPPCQSYSSSGAHGGADDPRGQLFFDTIRIISEVRPKLAIIENVKGLTFKKHADTFNKILSQLKDAGYEVYHKVLNACDYNIPQSRNRVFFVCIRNDLDNGNFQFPEPKPLTRKLWDILDDVVDEKYYLTGKHLVYWKKNQVRDCKKGFSSMNREIAVCQTARQYANWKGNYVTDDKKLSCIGYVDNKNCQSARVYDDALACTLTSGGGGFGNTGLYLNNERVRKLTPKETLRLMDFDVGDYDKLAEIGLADGKIYKLSGNSICVGVVCEIMKNIDWEAIMS